MNDNNYGNTECLAGPQGHNSCSTFGFKPLTPRACIHDIFQELRTSFELSGLKSEIGLCVRVLPQRSTIRSNLLVSGSLLRRMCGYYRPLYLIYWAPSPIIRWFDIHTFFETSQKTTCHKGKGKQGRWKEQAWCLLLLRVVVHVCFTAPCVPNQTHNISQRTKKKHTQCSLLESKKGGCLVHLVWKVWRISGAENKQHLVFSAKPICGRFFPHSWQQIVSRLVFNLDSFLTDCTIVLPSTIVQEVPQPKF